MRPSWYKSLLVLGVVGAFAAAQAQFVNGDFQTGTLSGWTLANSTNGQSFVSDVQPFDTGVGTSLAGHFQVGQVTFTSGQEAGILLTQSLNLTAGTPYTFSFTWAAQNTNTSNNADGGTFDLIVAGNSIGSHATGSLAAGTSVNGSVTGTFTPGSSGAYDVGAYIHRHFIANSGINQYVDNFSMSPVPEPATMAVLGVGALALMRRRKRA